VVVVAAEDSEWSASVATAPAPPPISAAAASEMTGLRRSMTTSVVRIA
jgi:hypothetical protein